MTKEQDKAETCEYALDEDIGAYDTECGKALLLNDGTPAENNFKFCPFCGRRIQEGGSDGN